MKLKLAFLVAVVCVLSACGGGHLEGTYTGEYLGKNFLSFKPNGKVLYMGMAELAYEIDGKDIKLHMPDQKVWVLKMLDDGSIQAPMFGKLTKVAG